MLFSFQVRDKVRAALRVDHTTTGARKRSVSPGSPYKTRPRSPTHLGGTQTGAVDGSKLLAALQKYDPGLKPTKTKLRVGGKQVKQAPTGVISVVDFERGLLSLGVDITPEEMIEVLTDLGLEADGKVRYQGKLLLFAIGSGCSITLFCHLLLQAL